MPVLKVFIYIVLFAWPHLSWAQNSTPKLDVDELDRRASLLMNQLEMAGMAMAVIEDGEIVFAKGYGERLRDSGQLVTADTVFRWASVSKSVAAHTVLDLAAEGKLSLSAPAHSFAPSLKLPPSEQPATLRDLLSHRTGIIRNAYDNRIEGGRSAKPSRRALESLPYQCPPGTCHGYQNLAFDATSEAIEGVTRLPYKTVLQSRVFDVLGMTTASVTHEGLVRSKNWARPHDRFGEAVGRAKPNYYRVPAAAGINSSVKDLAKWLIAQMDETDDSAKMMQEPVVPTPREQAFLNRRFGALQNAHYSMGWRVYDYAGHKIIGHRGGVEGYRALALFDPEKKAGIAIMWNSPHVRPVGLQMEFLDQLYNQPRRDWLRLNEGQR